MNTTDSVRNALAQNRSEELGYDVWSEFVVPPFFSNLNVGSATKARVFIGGRGCGKTMLLRYLSHQSAFSPQRVHIPSAQLEEIGLYWRIDTTFASQMTKRGLETHEWQTAFAHITAVGLGIELLASLQSVAQSRMEAVSLQDLRSLDLGRLRAFDRNLPPSASALAEALADRQWQFESWMNNLRSSEEPHFLPGKAFVTALITLVRQQLPALAKTTFHLYLDEYENLLPYQQQTVNTWMKHSEPPFVVNIAVKRNGFDLRATLGSESLSNIHDYRIHDLEAYLNGAGRDSAQEFKTFAAEVMLHRMAVRDARLEVPIKATMLMDPEQLPSRGDAAYRAEVLKCARSLLPGLSHEEMAEAALDDQSVRAKLRARIRTALGGDADVDAFLRPECPEATIVVPALLNRTSISAVDVLRELDNLEAGAPNRFTGPTNWIHNNFIGCLLQLYDARSRACPFYAGFDTFCDLAAGNLRHFLELCHKSLSRSPTEGVWPVPIPQQAEAARAASTTFLAEIRSFGASGNRLHAFVLRLGTLLQLSHRRPSQSEPEQTHISIKGGTAELAAADHEFLREATKWSVLFEVEGTKKKDEATVEALDYVLNPIYAPYFYISYRKKRKLDVTTDEFITLVRGPANDINTMLSRYKRRWQVAPEEAELSLFDTTDIGR